MHELNRLAYLDAMGIEHYLSRSQLPGAAPSQRLAIARRSSAMQTGQPEPAPHSPPVAEIGQLPKVGRETRRPTPQARQQTRAREESNSPSRFSLATIVAGNWLWVEDLHGMPLAREQVQLVQAMAGALGRQLPSGSGPGESSGLPPADVAQFDWPIHTNQQLDLGEEAARTALAGFLGRKLERGRLGLVLLGTASAQRVPQEELACPRVTVSHSSAEILADPSLKKRAWAELKTIVNRA